MMQRFRNLSLALFLCLAALVAGCGGSDDPELAAMRHANDSLQAIVDAKDSEVNALFEMLNQIEDNLSMISAKYGTVRELKSNNPEASYNSKTEINDQLANIDKMLAANKQKIAELNAKIKQMGVENSQLQDFVAKLEERISGQEAQIAQLESELAYNKTVIHDLGENVASLTEENAQKDRTIAHHIAEANKAYFIVGNYDKLKEMGVVAKSGGFIGIGRKQSVVPNLPTSKFVEIDRTVTTTIEVGMRGAVVVSSHPESSYELVSADNDEKTIAYLRILNPSLFWQNTKYLVVSTSH